MKGIWTRIKVWFARVMRVAMELTLGWESTGVDNSALESATNKEGPLESPHKAVSGNKLMEMLKEPLLTSAMFDHTEGATERERLRKSVAARLKKRGALASLARAAALDNQTVRRFAESKTTGKVKADTVVKIARAMFWEVSEAQSEPPPERTRKRRRKSISRMRRRGEV